MLSGLSVSSDFLHRSKLKGSGGANRSVNFVYVGRETPLGQQNGQDEMRRARTASSQKAETIRASRNEIYDDEL
jgi:hypothetical protein